MSDKFLELKSGIGNQLIPLISMIRICDKFNFKLYVKAYKINAYNHTNVNDKTYTIHNLLNINYDINIISSLPYNLNICNCNWNIEKNIITDNDKNNTLYYNVCHVFGTLNDKISDYQPYPTKNFQINGFLQELKMYAKLITPVDIINNKINNYINGLKCKVLGLHIRTLDGGFIEYYNQNKLFSFIEGFLKDNKDWKIYVSTDNNIIENTLIDKYGESILKLDNPFGNTYNDKFSDNNFGLMNAVYEIYILSKLDKFVGSVGSSFSFLSFLLSNNSSLDFWNQL